MNVAFIGVGNMGRPMLANLLKKGFSAIAYDIVPAALDSAMALLRNAIKLEPNSSLAHAYLATLLRIHQMNLLYSMKDRSGDNAPERAGSTSSS